jgi:succinyl-CoA synthetase beta subunit
MLYKFRTLTGEILIDHKKCDVCSDKPCLKACIPQILKQESGRAVLAIDEEAARKGKCIECLACELECEFHGKKGITISLPLPEAGTGGGN